MTSAEDKEIIDSLKRDWTPLDYYNFQDLNRVESATVAVKNHIGRLRGVTVPLGTIITNRTQFTVEFADSLNRVESNIEALKQSFFNPALYQETRTDWTYNKPFDFSDANRYEQNLYDMYYDIESNLINIPYCGQYIVGQEGVH